MKPRVENSDAIAFLADTIYTPLDEIRDGVVLVQKGVVAEVGSRRRISIPRGARKVDLGRRILAPGFVDIHTHGAAGHDFMTPEGADLIRVGQFYAAHGVTSYLASTMTADMPSTFAAARNVGNWVRSARGTWKPQQGARPVGIHFEGPFLSEIRCGAQPKEHIIAPSKANLARMVKAAGGAARVITLAPEVRGAFELLRFARRLGLRVAIGHSNATAEVASRAADLGATLATHLFNAMRPFSHHDPGIIGAVLVDDRIAAEVIADGVHVSAEALRLVKRAKGLDRTILITDSISAAGMPDGRYRLGTKMVEMRVGICRMRDGHLAGSTLTLDAALRNWSRLTGASEAESLRCATLNPARAIGMEKRVGVIAPGASADFVALDKAWNVKQTYIGGELFTGFGEGKRSPRKT